MKRRIFCLSMILTLVLSFGISLLAPHKAYAANNDPDVDKRRRILIAAYECFKREKVFDTDDNIISGSIDDMYSDLINGGSPKEENVVVGFAVDSDNGVSSCGTMMPRG